MLRTNLRTTNLLHQRRMDDVSAHAERIHDELVSHAHCINADPDLWRRGNIATADAAEQAVYAATEAQELARVAAAAAGLALDPPIDEEEVLGRHTVEAIAFNLNTLGLCVLNKRTSLEDVTQGTEPMPFQRASDLMYWTLEAQDALRIIGHHIHAGVFPYDPENEHRSYPLRGHESAPSLSYALGKIVKKSMFTNMLSPMGSGPEDFKREVRSAAIVVADSALTNIIHEMERHVALSQLSQPGKWPFACS